MAKEISVVNLDNDHPLSFDDNENFRKSKDAEDNEIVAVKRKTTN